ncbi:MAG: hypothetical protein QXG57_06205 [Thermofilaceae archaeon]
MAAEFIKKKAPKLVKLALKYVLAWLIDELFEELKDGVRFKVKIRNEEYDVVIKLASYKDCNCRIVIVD